MYFVNRRSEEEDQDRRNRAYVKQETYSSNETRKKRLWPRILSAVLAIAAIVLFFLTEDMTLPWIWTDQWTIWHIVIFVLLVVFAIVAAIKVNSDDEKNQPEPQEATSKA